MLQPETVQAAADDRAAAAAAAATAVEAIDLLNDEDDMQQVHPAVSEEAWDAACKSAFAPEAATAEEEVRLRIRVSYNALSLSASSLPLPLAPSHAYNVCSMVMTSTCCYADFYPYSHPG